MFLNMFNVRKIKITKEEVAYSFVSELQKGIFVDILI